MNTDNPSFDCVFPASLEQKKISIDYYEAQYDDETLRAAEFELLKFLPHSYYFQICVKTYDIDTPWPVTLNCNKTLKELMQENQSFYVAVCDEEGAWYEDGVEGAIISLTCPTALSVGESEGAINIEDDNLTVNDVVAFLERRGMTYIENLSAKNEMKNFRSKVNDNHVWAYPNLDLTPTKEQMWDMVKSSRVFDLPIYKNYIDLEMINYYLENNNALFNRNFKVELRQTAIVLSEHQNLMAALELKDSSNIDNISRKI